MERPDGIVDYEEVVKQLNDLTVSNDINLSIRGDFPELLHVTFKVEKENYEQAIAWLVKHLRIPSQPQLTATASQDP